MYQYYLYLAIIILIAVGYLCVTMPVIEWLRLHLHRPSQDVLVDEDDALDLIERFGYTLNMCQTPSPFSTNPTPVLVKYTDSFGRTVVHKVRWMEVHYYYVNQHWLTILEKVWPVNEEESTQDT